MSASLAMGADLLLLSGNPLTDLDVLRQPLQVIEAGEVVWNPIPVRVRRP